jgi:hypothetical protein
MWPCVPIIARMTPLKVMPLEREGRGVPHPESAVLNENGKNMTLSLKDYITQIHPASRSLIIPFSGKVTPGLSLVCGLGAIAIQVNFH